MKCAQETTGRALFRRGAIGAKARAGSAPAESRAVKPDAISQEFGRSVDWLLTGKTHTEPKKRAASDSAELE